MALVSRWNDDWLSRDPFWNDRWRDWFDRETWDDWPKHWPAPRDVVSRFDRGSRWWDKWPSDWPSMNSVLPRFSSHLDRFDRNWRDDPFWRDLYPRWAEPIFKDGLDVRTNVYNDRNRFAVEVDTYQFRPEELEVKMLDDTLVIEGRHEDVRDRDNYTKMYFVRKYQLPPDVYPQDITSSIDSAGRLTVEARKPYAALNGRERVIPIEGSSRRIGSRSNSYSRDLGRNGATYDDRYYRPSSRGADYVAADRDREYRSSSRNGFHRTEFATETIPVQTVRESYSRSASRSSRREYSEGPDGFYRSEVRSSSRGPGEFRSSSRGPVGEFRSSSRLGGGGENLLRPEPELGERSASRLSRREFSSEHREARYT